MDALNCVWRCMLVLSLPFCVEWTKHWERLIYCLFQTFSSLFPLKKILYLSTQTDLWRSKSLLFTADLLWIVHGLVQLLLHIEMLLSLFFGFNVPFLLLIHLEESMLWSYDPPWMMLTTYVMDSRNIIKSKVTTPHELFQAYLILLQ